MGRGGSERCVRFVLLDSESSRGGLRASPWGVFLSFSELSRLPLAAAGIYVICKQAVGVARGVTGICLCIMNPGRIKLLPLKFLPR